MMVLWQVLTSYLSIFNEKKLILKVGQRFYDHKELVEKIRVNSKSRLFRLFFDTNSVSSAANLIRTIADIL